MEVIRFYGRSLPCFELSNFFPEEYELPDGRVAKTSEHGFQADKFSPTFMVEVGTPPRSIALQDHILGQARPGDAARLGRMRCYPLRKDWEDFAPEVFEGKLRVKDLVMLKHLRLKFNQCAHCKEVLLGTEQARLIEASPIDFYWGEGSDRSGKDMLGTLLEHVRLELQVGHELTEIRLR